MARIVSLSDALQSDPGEQLPAVRGKVLKVGKYFRGESAKGPWSFQTVTLDDSTAKAEVKFKGREAFAPASVGKVMFIVANNGERGLTGVRVEDDEYQGKVTRIVLVTSSAEVTFGKGDWSETSKPEPAATVAKAAAKAAQTTEASDDYPGGDEPPKDIPAGQAAATEGGLDGIKVDVNRIRKLHLICCAAAAHNVAALHKAGINVGDEFLQAAAATIFIESCKRGGVTSVPEHGDPAVNFPKFDF